MNPTINKKYNFLSLSVYGSLGLHQEEPMYDEEGLEWCTSSLDDCYCPNFLELDHKQPRLFQRSSDGWTEIESGKWEVC